jgi:acyl-CoA thioesterase YciA
MLESTAEPMAPPRTEPVIRTITMPADTNPSGDIFGGWLLAQMDMAGASVATKRARGRCATIALEAMTFHRPVFVGDELSLYGTIERIGRTSLRVRVEAWRRPRFETTCERVTEGVFTFVAIDEERRPRPVPAE